MDVTVWEGMKNILLMKYQETEDYALNAVCQLGSDEIWGKTQGNLS